MISIITPTWKRPMQLARCMLSVARQTRLPVEHVIVSDGSDDTFTRSIHEYARQLSVHYPGYSVIADSLSEHDPDAWWGRRAKLRGVELASGTLINCLDDDDVLYRDHVRLLSNELRLRPQIGFTFSRLWIGPMSRAFRSEERRNIAHGGPEYPDMQSIFTGAQFMFRRELLKIAAWDLSDAPEWPMVEKWLANGTRWSFVDHVTCQMYQHDDYSRDGYPPGRCN